MNFNQVLPISISTQHFILQIIRVWRKRQAGKGEIWRPVLEFAVSRSDKGLEAFGDDSVIGAKKGECPFSEA